MKKNGLANLDDDLAVERMSLAEIAAERLRELILIGKLPPGQPLSERELSERLRISRTPLREAIRELAAERLIDVLPNRRPQVADPSLEHIEDLFDVQAALEALAGRLFTKRATQEQIDELVAIHERFSKFPDDCEPLKFFRTDMAFHSAIVRGADNVALADTHRQYNAALFRARFMSSRQLRWRDITIAEHTEILDALCARDAERSAAALTTHLMSGRANQRMLDPDAD
ncbi:GntR family transcriptional regulator [Aliiruegeria lutimaris]|uniref:Transcriptional regulator, GntR family n=1 Tax=Aliiruegeria lutimaris TaxID=571298 RepID=A0A1G8R1D6_9RHOB|nr:GntR family transcriptional regulator [Aliiruegeria lutimaris]SDJ10385.1 transcriptional regulator, GntR family [Aliiruegeria lutimaris]